MGKLHEAQRWLTLAEVDRVAERYRARETMARLAKAYGCRRLTISAHLRKAGIAAKVSRAAPEMIEEIVRFYRTGLS